MHLLPKAVRIEIKEGFDACRGRRAVKSVLARLFIQNRDGAQGRKLARNRYKSSLKERGAR
jgi:hypothetical protein